MVFVLFGGNKQCTVKIVNGCTMSFLNKINEPSWLAELERLDAAVVASGRPADHDR